MLCWPRRALEEKTSWHSLCVIATPFRHTEAHVRLSRSASKGLEPEIIPSTFAEDLNHSDFPNVYEYPVTTASHKAVEVYEKLVVSEAQASQRNRNQTENSLRKKTQMTLQTLSLAVSDIRSVPDFDLTITALAS